MPSINSYRLANQERARRARQIIAQKRQPRKKPTKQTNHEYLRIQNRLRDLIEKVRPRALKPTQEIGTGVDYTFAGKKIDFKFCFGALGENTISVRIRNRELINNSDWTMLCNQKGDLLIIRTQRIRDYVAANASTVKKNFVLSKGNYALHRISLADILGNVKFNENMRSERNLLKALRKFNRKESPLPKVLTPLHRITNAPNPRITRLVMSWRPPIDRRIGRNRDR